MPFQPINLIKLCVGARNVSDLVDWQKSRLNSSGMVYHVTRMWPKRKQEILSGGSIYWVFKGLILARQKIVGFEEVVGEDEIRRCGLILDKEIYRTEPRPKRAFQGWRYLTLEEAPKDLFVCEKNDSELPREMQIELSKLGVL